MSLGGKIAVVIGAGQGLGRGIALRLASEGADIGVVDVNGDTAKATAQEISKLGRKALPITLDISDVPQIQPAVERVVQQFGAIDIWVNNAAVMQTKAMLEISEEDWDRVLDVNAKGAFFCTQAAARQMVKQRKGLIVNITSGQRARPMATPYAASKMAIDIITKSAALALALKRSPEMTGVCSPDLTRPKTQPWS